MTFNVPASDDPINSIMVETPLVKEEPPAAIEVTTKDGNILVGLRKRPATEVTVGKVYLIKETVSNYNGLLNKEQVTYGTHHLFEVYTHFNQFTDVMLTELRNHYPDYELIVVKHKDEVNGVHAVLCDGYILSNDGIRLYTDSVVDISAITTSNLATLGLDKRPVEVQKPVKEDLLTFAINYQSTMLKHLPR